MAEVRGLFEAHHGYGGVGRLSTYYFGVIEEGSPVAAYVWNPPAPGAAKSVSPGEPSGALALVRMVAVPRHLRALNHVSKPLRSQMRVEIDRARWPVLLTYSDASLGHTGHVYKCSGWEKEGEKKANFFEVGGVRVSSYARGKTVRKVSDRTGQTILTRWVHRACPKGTEAGFMSRGGWYRVPTGRVWRSGNPAYTWENSGQPSD